jgi:RNA polymerase sigma factor (sigma-70 family)
VLIVACEVSERRPQKIHDRDEMPISLATERLLRDLAPQVLGATMRKYGDFAAAEDAVQDALIAAATQWPRDGVPDNPRGWLIQVASRRMTDHIRSESARRRREHEAAQQIDELVPAVEHDAEQDDTLILLFMCGHEALTSSSAIALTLRAVGGLTTAEIARAYFVPEATMAQRISRAKSTIKASGIPFRLPSGGEQETRLRSVLHVLYLIFNEGYTSSDGAHLQRTDLAREAIRLTRAVHRSLPDESDVKGLLALMLLTDARRDARTGQDGELMPLDKQDRTRWDRAQIEEGVALVTEALSSGSVGLYQVQAAIAAVHDEASRAEDTDWPQILALYTVLNRLSDNPMIALSHAIATAMVDGPTAGLHLLEELDADGRMKNHHRLHAVRAHLLEMAGDHQEAIAQYRAAADKTTSIPERKYLMAQAGRLTAKVQSDSRTSVQTD